MSAAHMARNLAQKMVRWSWPPDARRYDQSPALSQPERQALVDLADDVKNWRDAQRPEWAALTRLVAPLLDVTAALHTPDVHARHYADRAVAYLLHACLREDSTYWAWDRAAWVRVCGTGSGRLRAAAPEWGSDLSRQYVLALAYLLGDFPDALPGTCQHGALAVKMFGPSDVKLATDRVTEALAGWGYGSARSWALPKITCAVLVLRRSCDLADISAALVDRLRDAPGATRAVRSDLYRLRRALETLGLVAPIPWRESPPLAAGEGVNSVWKEWVDRWYATSALTLTTRRSNRSLLLRVGRWLAAEHPHIQSPADWTRKHCATFTAYVTRARYGEYVGPMATGLIASRVGEPLLPRTKDGQMYAVRQLMRDCQEWDWMPRRFDPARALRTPKSIKALIGPDPRVIDDKIWAKLMWAGLNVTLEDFPRGLSGTFYPIELLRALTLTWLFAGLRSDEIARLTVGCIRWQSNDAATSGDGAAEDAVCLLDVPTNKTGTAFTKPVEPLVGRAIAAWDAVRPHQPAFRDRKTGAEVDLLFCYRARRLSSGYINNTVIPALCRKAGVPVADARGRITSHRARSTIASQLYNAKDPMTLFELQAWLGHRSPSSTQHYAKITPTTLTKAYKDAGYFARNIRVIEVIVDRDSVESGAAASGEPWQHFDLGHGYCTYDFFEKCPHRMACARCEFYVPKGSAQAQLLEAKRNLQRMLLEIPLTDDERAAVEGDDAAVDQLLKRLAEVPTPAGPTPRALGGSRPLVPLTVVDSRSRNAASETSAGENVEVPSGPGATPKSEPRQMR